MKHLYTPFLAAGLALALTACTDTTDDPGPDPDVPVAAACDGISCGNGQCNAEAEVAVCECDPGWDGALCDELIPPPQDDLVLWLDGDDPQADGTDLELGEIEEWIDKSSIGADFWTNLDNTPSLVATENGRTAVQFDGIDDWMLSWNFAAFNGQDDYTIVIVGFGGNNNNVLLAGTSSATGEHGLLVETETGKNLRFLHRMPWGNAGGDDNMSTGSAMSSTELNRLRLERRGGVTPSLTTWVNDAVGEKLVAASVDFDNNVDLMLGSLGPLDSVRFLDGQIAEVLIYRGVLASDEAAALDVYLEEKWTVE